MAEQILDGAELTDYARAKVGPPSIGLLVAGSLGFAMSLLSTTVMLYSPMLGQLFWPSGPGPSAGPAGPPGLAEVGLPIAVNVLVLIVSSYVLYGANQMRKLQSYGRARSACIFSMIPCFGPCLLLGIPFGIWGLVVLRDPQVKSAFEASIADTFR